MQKFTFWDLREDVKTKFRIEIDPYLFASDLMVVEEFDFLPKMIKPLEIQELQDFFKQLSKKLGKESIE